MIPDSKVQPFDFTLTVPLQKYFNSVDTLKNIGRGTMPDHAVNMTINEILKGEDKELQTTLDLIKSGSK